MSPNVFPRKRVHFFRRLLTSTAWLSLCLTGCKLGPDYERPEVIVPAAYSYQPIGGKPLDEAWYGVFQDPVLEDLIRRASANNRSLASLYFQTLQARALIRSERSEALPQIDVGGSYTRFEDSSQTGFGQTEAEDLFSASALAGWELDVFGRVRRLVEAAEADARAVEEAYLDLLLFIETEVAATYFLLQANLLETAAVEGSVQTRSESLDIVRERFRGGFVSDLDVAQAETLLAFSESDLAGLELERDQLIHALALLLGQAASTFSIEPRLMSGAAPEIPSGLPSELLRRRPDIRQAEQDLVRANALVGVATANFFPRFALSGEVGYAAFEAEDWFESASNFYSFGPSVSLPIFQGGRLRADKAQAVAAYRSAVVLYRQSILEALVDVEDALTAWRHLRRQRAALERAAESARRAQSVSDEQYRSGVIDFITALDAEREALDAERALAQVMGAEFVNSALLVRALGGSWSSELPAYAPTQP